MAPRCLTPPIWFDSPKQTLEDKPSAWIILRIHALEAHRRWTFDLDAPLTEPLLCLCERCGFSNFPGMEYVVSCRGNAWRTVEYGFHNLAQLAICSGDTLIIEAYCGLPGVGCELPLQITVLWADRIRRQTIDLEVPPSMTLGALCEHCGLNVVPGMSHFVSCRGRAWNTREYGACGLWSLGICSGDTLTIEADWINRPTSRSPSPRRTVSVSPRPRLVERGFGVRSQEDVLAVVAQLVLRIADALARQGVAPEQLFAKLDTYGEGRLSRRQLEQFFVTFEPDLPPRVLLALFNTFDENRNGDVDLREFCRTLAHASEDPFLDAQ